MMHEELKRETVCKYISEMVKLLENGCYQQEILKRAVELLSAEPMQWIPVGKALPSDYNLDWVLAQVQEYNGYLWIPKVMEYRKAKDDWFGTDEYLGWLKDHYGAFRVVAWMPLPKLYRESEGAK